MENRIQRKKNKIYVALEMKDTFILSPSLNIGRFNFFLTLITHFIQNKIYNYYLF
jgi:hypothetical protein